MTNGDIRNPLVLSDEEGILSNLYVDRGSVGVRRRPGRRRRFQKGGNPYFGRRPVEDRDRHFMREVYVRPGGDAFRRQQRRFENAYVRHFRRYSGRLFPAAMRNYGPEFGADQCEPEQPADRIEPGRQHQLYLYGDRSGTADRRFPEFEGSWRRIGTIENPIFKTAYVGACADARIDQRTPFRLSAKLRGYGIGQEALITFYMSEDAFARAGSRVVLHAEPGSVGHDRVQRRRRRILLLALRPKPGIADGEPSR